MSATSIGLDRAKSIFQIHGVDAQGRTVLKRRIRRRDLLTIFEELPACLVGMEAYKAYDADKFRSWLKKRRIKAVIPSNAARNIPYPLDRDAYRRRNAIERMFGQLKNWRRIATRYDRLARKYLAGLDLVSIVIAWT